MSTLAIGALVNYAVAGMNGASYINVGVWNGFTLFSGMAGNPGKEVLGIDNFSEFGGPREAFLGRYEGLCRSDRHRFIEDDFERYFETHTAPIGVYYYDGAHDYVSQYRGLEVAAPFFAPSAVIFVDDWNTQPPRDATRDFIAAHTGYSITFECRTATNEHPTFWNGLAIIEAPRQG